MKIVIDGKGGDFAPQEIVKGIVQAAKERCPEIIVTGDRDKLRDEFLKWGGLPKGVEIHHAPEVVSMEDSPAQVLKEKKKSSLVQGAMLVKEGAGDVFLSAGNTGATLAAGIFVIGRLKGISRPGIATALPGQKGMTLLIDAGANADFKPPQLVHFAQMGSIYTEKVLGKKRPTVGLLNVGKEAGKGNKGYQEAYSLLKDSSVNFVGNVEGRELAMGLYDVVVSDGFVGNITLKVIEGTASTMVGILTTEIKSSMIAKVGALLMKNSLRAMKQKLDFEEYGGAPLLGLNAPVIICHGSSTAKAVKNAISVGEEMVEKQLVKAFQDHL